LVVKYGMKKMDIFSGCTGFLVVFVLVAAFILADKFTNEIYSNYLWMVFFFIIGAHCLWNYYSCGRAHCLITGWGFLGVGVIALLQVLGVIGISWRAIWIIFIVVLVVGFGYEFVHKSKSGSCYVKK